jgi:hypothetical protein
MPSLEPKMAERLRERAVIESEERGKHSISKRD